MYAPGTTRQRGRHYSSSYVVGGRDCIEPGLEPSNRLQSTDGTDEVHSNDVSISLFVQVIAKIECARNQV